mgnify:CR=1 FL=1
MDDYLEIKVKNHKILNKKILFVEYLKDNVKFDLQTTRMLIKEYLKILEKEERVVLIFDVRMVKNFDKKTVWEGAGELKKYEKIFLKYVSRAYIISENNLLNNLVNIILKVMNNVIPTVLVKDINSALKDLSTQSK